MASPLSRPSICGLQTALSSCRISTTTTTKSATAPWRAFSTTTSFSQAVPPESPRFITIPEPPQSSEPRPPPVKGHLPVPRDPFPKREGNRKVKAAYIAAATPVSKSELAGEEPRSEEEARHRVIAAARRAAFASGIQGLFVRKTQREQRLHARSERRLKANQDAATAPERLDDVLTRPTVRASTALQTSVALDPERFAKAEAARAQHEQTLALKAESRRDALAQLYVAAQNFILDEAELERRIEAAFKETTFKDSATSRRGTSIWDTEKAPVSVAELQAELSGSSKKVTEHKRVPTYKATQRQKLVAEELTGGKL